MSREINAQHVMRGDLPSIPPTEIVVDHAYNTRMYEPDISDLVESFKKLGQLQACVVRPLPDKRVQLVAGYRRWLAAMEICRQQQSEGIDPKNRFKLKVEVQRANTGEALLKNIAENFHRNGLSHTEVWRAITMMRNLNGMVGPEGTKEIAKHFNKSPAWVTTYEDVVPKLTDEQRYNLHKHWQSRGQEGISFATAKVLSACPEEEQQAVLMEAQKAASMESKNNDPVGKLPNKALNNDAANVDSANGNAPKSKGVKGIKGVKAVSAREVAKVAERSGADPGSLPNRTAKDLREFVRQSNDDVHPLHPLTKELLKRIDGFFDRSVTEKQLDATILRIDELAHFAWDEYSEHSAGKKKQKSNGQSSGQSSGPKISKPSYDALRDMALGK